MYWNDYRRTWNIDFVKVTFAFKMTLIIYWLQLLWQKFTRNGTFHKFSVFFSIAWYYFSSGCQIIIQTTFCSRYMKLFLVLFFRFICSSWLDIEMLIVIPIFVEFKHPLYWFVYVGAIRKKGDVQLRWRNINFYKKNLWFEIDFESSMYLLCTSNCNSKFVIS